MVTRAAHGRHVITYRIGKSEVQHEWKCDAVAVCSGLHVKPNVPHISGVENVPLTMHSSEFKTRYQFGVNKVVLVLGSGETAADIAYLAVTSPTTRVVMCHRNGFHIAPTVRFTSNWLSRWELAADHPIEE